MKKSGYSNGQILATIRQVENSVPIPELRREHGMGNALFYKWWATYGGMDALLIREWKS